MSFHIHKRPLCCRSGYRILSIHIHLLSKILFYAVVVAAREQVSKIVFTCFFYTSLSIYIDASFHKHYTHENECLRIPGESACKYVSFTGLFSIAQDSIVTHYIPHVRRPAHSREKARTHVSFTGLFSIAYDSFDTHNMCEVRRLAHSRH